MGHPIWYDNVVKHGKKPCEIYKRYIRIIKSRICLYCLTGNIEPHAMAVATIRLIEYGRKIRRRS